MNAISQVGAQLEFLENNPGKEIPDQMRKLWHKAGAMNCKNCWRPHSATITQGLEAKWPNFLSIGNEQYSLGAMVRILEEFREDCIRDGLRTGISTPLLLDRPCDVFLHLIHLGKALMSLMDSTLNAIGEVVARTDNVRTMALFL